MALGPKYHEYCSIWALKPCYLGPWTLRDIDAQDFGVSLQKLRSYQFHVRGLKVSSADLKSWFFPGVPRIHIAETNSSQMTSSEFQAPTKYYLLQYGGFPKLGVPLWGSP